MKKRIALAVVAALAGGLLAAAPASAAVAGTFDTSSATTGTVGGFANVVFNLDTTTATTYSVLVNNGTIGSISGNTVSTSATAIGGGTAVYPATGLQFVDSASAATALETITVAAPAGTQTITVNKLDSVTGAVQASYVWSIVWSAPSTTPIYSTLYDHSAVALTAAAGTYADGNGNLFAAAAPAQTLAGTLSVTQYGAATETTTNMTVQPYTKAVTVTMTGVGAVGKAGSTAAYLAVSAGQPNPQTFSVYSDGRSGVGTITVAVNGVVVATKTITFYGAVASYTASLDKANIAASGTNSTSVLTVTAKDANGVLVPNAPVNVSSGTAAVASVMPASGPTLSSGANIGTETFTVTGLSKGDSLIKVANADASVSTTVNAHVVTAGFASVTVAFDTATYLPGAKAILTITVKNSDGVAAADGAWTLFDSAGLTSSAQLGGVSLPFTTGTQASSQVTIANGVAAYTVYMPLAVGPILVSGKDLNGNTVSTSATVGDSGAAAAAKATSDAIAALQTSVGSLTTTVAALVASMTAQIKVINASLLAQGKRVAALQKALAKLLKAEGIR